MHSIYSIRFAIPGACRITLAHFRYNGFHHSFQGLISTRWFVIFFGVARNKMRSALLVLVAAGALFATSVLAQLRALPQDGKRGNVKVIEYPLVKIGSDTLRLSPGAIIRDDNNRIITPNFLQIGADVVFALDMNGDINRVFILTVQEQELLNRQ